PRAGGRRGPRRHAGGNAPVGRAADRAVRVRPAPPHAGRRVPLADGTRRRGQLEGRRGIERPAAPAREAGVSVAIREPSVRRAPATVGGRVTRAISHGWLLMMRNLVTLTRVPTVFVFELVQPVMFVLLFR